MTSQWLSHWNDELSAKSGRLLILTLIFSKRTISLKAGAFFSLSMETFITVSAFSKIQRQPTVSSNRLGSLRNNFDKLAVEKYLVRW